MASLRKRPSDVDAAVVPDPLPVANAQPETLPPPAPELGSDASEALKAQIEALRQSEAVQAAEQRRQAWLSTTPAARENMNALGAFHHAAMDSGLIDASPEYFRFMQLQLAELQRPAKAATHMAEEMQQRAEQSRVPEPPPRPSRVMVSAPVSREIPTSDGPRSSRTIKLTPQEIEMARISGVSIEEYGRQKLKLQTMRATGEYIDQGERR